MLQGAHICMTGTLECSGIAPCDGCRSAIITHVLVPAMKAANIDQRNDPRVARFLGTYAEAGRALIAGVLDQVAASQAPLPMPPPPSVPPVADLPLTAAELEGMASPIAAPPPPPPEPPLAGGPEPEAPTPPGLMSDEQFRTQFPTIEPAAVMDVPPPAEEPPSLMRLAAQAITPTLPADKPASDAHEVGSAPTEPAPSPAPQPKASTDDVSAVAVSADSPAEDTVTTTSVQATESDTKAEASSHG